MCIRDSTEPQRVNDMVKSFIAFYEQNGRLPVWNFWGSETDMMIGYRKGLGNIIISASLQSVYDIQIGVIGRQQNNRNPGRVFLDLPEQLKPTAIRQIDIQQHQGSNPAKQLFSCRF